MEPQAAQQFIDHMTQMLAQQQDIINTLLSQRATAGLRVDGLKLPTYSGRLKESAHLFFGQMGQYFAARGTDWQDAAITTRVLAILGSALRGPAAQWYMTWKDAINSVDQFFTELDREFVPTGLQQRLREEINNLRQKDCKNITNYIVRFRQLNFQIKGINEIDKIVYFQRGLRQETREEIQYRRCPTLADAITVALVFERAHPYSRRQDPPRLHTRPTVFHGPEPMEIDNARPFRPQRRVQNDTRIQRDSSRPSKWCRYCNGTQSNSAIAKAKGCVNLIPEEA